MGEGPSSFQEVTITLAAPFPYVGTKKRVAPLVWEALGEPSLYVEPFGGSLAVLLAAPSPVPSEIVNDANGFVANFWRALRHDPTGIADLCRDPVVEVDYKARHRWLVTEGLRRLRDLNMVTDPTAHDPLVAAWWAWGQSISIGRWCLPGTEPGVVEGGLNQRPNLDPSSGFTSEQRVAPFAPLARRLRDVRVLSGDWKRTVTEGVLLRRGPTVKNPTAVFLDPPYRAEMRDNRLYGASSEMANPVVLNDEVEAWCRAAGADPRLRIVLAGLEGEYDLPGWETTAWRAPGASEENRDAERLWFSPHCRKVTEQQAFF